MKTLVNILNHCSSGEEGNDEEVGKYAEALDVFSNLEDLATKINCDRLPHGFVSRFTEESAAFSLVTVPPGDNSDSRPELSACLVVQVTLSQGPYNDVHTTFGIFGPPPPPSCLHFGQILSIKFTQPPLLHLHLGNPIPPARVDVI